MISLVLELRDIEVRRGDALVLSAGHLAFAAGLMHAVIGANGSGKSTLIELLAGVRVPTSGRVWLEGRDLRDWNVSERAAALSCLFQEQHAAFDFEVLDYAALGSGRGARGERERSAWAALARVGLAGCARRRWSTLSGGERQRAALARCLAAEARVLLLDEVTNHLDLRTRSDLAELLAVERQRGHTIVVATHDLELASMADRIVILSRGHVAAAGDPSALLSTCALAESFGVRLRVFPDPSTGAPVVRLGSNDAESSTFATQPYPLRTQP